MQEKTLKITPRYEIECQIDGDKITLLKNSNMLKGMRHKGCPEFGEK